MLDSRTLLSTAMVSKKWLNLCRADSTLRKRILQQIILERKERLNPIVFSIQRKHPNNYCPLSTVNGNHRITVAPVSSKFSMLSLFVKINAMFSTELHNYVIVMLLYMLSQGLTLVLLS
jgi:hypothetical protein